MRRWRPPIRHRRRSHGHMSGYVLAFATARPADGGAGAMYMLLRRDQRRARFDVLQGAKRRD
jgi:hypothetical protein